MCLLWKRENEEINLSFEICDDIYDKDAKKESYYPIELTYLISFLNSFKNNLKKFINIKDIILYIKI